MRPRRRLDGAPEERWDIRGEERGEGCAGGGGAGRCEEGARGAQGAAVPKRTETAAVALMAPNPETAAEPLAAVPPAADGKPDAAQ